MKRMRYFAGLGTCYFYIHRQAPIYLSASIIKNKWINLVCSDHRVLLETRLLSDLMEAFRTLWELCSTIKKKRDELAQVVGKKLARQKAAIFSNPKRYAAFHIAPQVLAMNGFDLQVLQARSFNRVGKL
jgi:hypothetical protein